MRLQRIYSSKLYVTSTRKDRIHAAINSDNKWNVALVQQLEEYLDQDALAELQQAEAEAEAKQGVSDDVGGAAPDTGEESGGSSRPSLANTPPSPSFSGSPLADFGDDELADIDIPEDIGEEAAPEEPSGPEPEEPIESVTQEGRPITSATIIKWNTLDDVISACDTIKGTLNSREDTNGVTRLEVKDSELWVYYNDESNLNDKMIEVISVLNSIGYTYLKFNRLARSNNAIVFDIILNASEPIKTVKELEEEK